MSNTKQLTGAVAFLALIAVIDNFFVVESDPKLANMASIDAGVFQMGSQTGLADERPVHEVSLGAFWIDKFEVSNGDFAKFIEATGYITQSEKGEGGLVFASPNESLDPEKWWNLIASANWRHPNGSDGELAQIDNEDHPVVQVSFDDALAYCNWLGQGSPHRGAIRICSKRRQRGRDLYLGKPTAAPKRSRNKFLAGCREERRYCE